MVKTTNLFFQCSTWSCGLLDKNPTQLYNTRQGTLHSTFSTWYKRHGLLLPSPLPTVDVRMILSAPKMVWRRLKSAVPVSRCMLSQAILSFSSTVHFLRYRHVLKAIGAVERKGSGLREQMALKNLTTSNLMATVLSYTGSYAPDNNQQMASIQVSARVAVW